MPCHRLLGRIGKADEHREQQLDLPHPLWALDDHDLGIDEISELFLQGPVAIVSDMLQRPHRELRGPIF